MMSVAFASGFSATTFARLLLQYSRYADGGRFSPDAAPPPLAFLPCFFATLAFLLAARLRFSPCASLIDFLPDAYGAFRKVASVDELSACE